jgi:tetratricopeptide (TPR) repeat protein
MCRHYYRRNSKQLKLIDDFDRNYRPEIAIQWYSKQSFVYKLVNKALRSEDIDQLYTFRFFIGDLSKNLAREHQKIVLSGERVLTVYRGVKLSNGELDQLKENQDKLISMNGYLSTSRLRQKALAFATKPTKRSDALPVLFEIECDVQQLGDNAIFADISMFSEYPDEKEVLFDLSAAFRLKSVQHDGQVWLIRMDASADGQVITQDYIEVTRRETDERTEAIMFGRLLCQMGHYEKSQRYFEQLLADPNGEDIAWIKFNIGRAVHYKGDLVRARLLYDQAYDQMINTDPPRIKDSAYVLNNIGNVLNTQGKHDDALQSYQRALKIRQTYYTTSHPDIAISLKNIGSLLSKLGKYDEALDFFQQALKIQEEYYPSGHPDIAYGLIYIGNVYQKQEKFDEALKFHQQALKIQEKYYPNGHPDIAYSLIKIGEIFKNQKKFDEALDFFQQALKIQEKYYPNGHSNIAYSLNRIGEIYQYQGKLDEALEFHQQALKIRETYYLTGHADTADSLNKIGEIYQYQGKLDEALECHQQALKIQENYYQSGHLDIAYSLNDIGNTYEQLKSKMMALDYYKQALTICDQHLPVGHQFRMKIETNIHRLSSQK